MSEEPARAEELSQLSKEELITRVLSLENQLDEKNREIDRKDRDSVTGWWKEERAKWELLKAVEEDPELSEIPMAVMAIDIQSLREVNNKYDHDAGNLLLEKFARTIDTYFTWLKQTYPYYGGNLKLVIPFRFHDHGDEFGIILLGVGWRTQEDIDQALVKKPIVIKVREGIIVSINFRVGFASSDGKQEKADLKNLRYSFPEEHEFVAEELRYLKRLADIRERNKKRNG